MSSQELQHYVPKFLLRRFVDPTIRRVHVFDKLTRNSFASNHDKVAAQNDYYNFEFGDLEISLEKALGNLESRAADHVARIIRDGYLHLEDERERADLAAFFAVQLVRTPAQEATSQEGIARMESWLRARGMPDSFFAFDPHFGSKENARHAEHVRMVHRAPELLGPHFVGRFRNPEGHTDRVFADAMEPMQELMLASRLLRLLEGRPVKSGKPQKS